MLEKCKGKFSLAKNLVGDPVDVITGANVDQSFEFRLIGPLEFRWHRNYDSSKSERQYAMGWGHTHDYERKLRFDNDGIRLEIPVGKEISFPPLREDGAETASQGHVLARISKTLYRVYHRGELPMQFEFGDLSKPACLTRIFQARHEIRFYYAKDQRLKGIVDSLGRRIKVSNTPEGLIRKLQLLGEDNQSEQLLVAYTYDNAGNLLSTQNNEGDGHTFTWDAQNRLTRRTGRTGFSFQFEYDAQGRCGKAWGDKRTHGVALNYEIPGSVTKVIRADLGEWIYLFGQGGLTQIIDAMGGSQEFAQDKAGRTTIVLDTNGNATEHVYDQYGALAGSIDPLGRVTQLPADPSGVDTENESTASNPAEYLFGRLVDPMLISLPSEQELREISLSNRDSKLVEMRSTKAGNKDLTRTFNVPPLGALWWPRPESGREFSDLGKLVGQQDEWGRRRAWTYDPSGNLASFIDFDGAEWTYTHGHWHFLTSLVSPIGAEVSMQYTPEGQVSKFVDAGGATSDYRYDSKGKLVEIKRHGVTKDSCERDAEGNVLAKYAGDGSEMIRFKYGSANLLTKRSLASGDEHEFSYDDAGTCLLASTHADSVKLDYDDDGNRLLEQCNGLGVEHEFGSWRSPVKSTYFDRFVVTREYAADGTITISDSTGDRQTLILHSHGLVRMQFSNGTEEFSQFDSLGRCLFKSAGFSKGKKRVKEYTWSGEGDLISIKDSSLGEITHEYDAAHRLLSRTHVNQIDRFDWDEADNLLSQPGLERVNLEQGNRIASANNERIVFNDRNHIASRYSPDRQIDYFYDSRDQLVRVKMPNGDWEAEYDAFGRRTRKTWMGKNTEFYWNNDQLIAERAETGALRLYIYVDQAALTPFMFIDYDSLTADPEAGEQYFVFCDQAGTPWLVENATGGRVWEVQISPFGQCEPESSKLAFNIRFPGHYRDPEIGLNYNMYRYYDPVLGRYIQSDPIGIGGGQNFYAYCVNPLLSVDVHGLGEEYDVRFPRDWDEMEAPQFRPRFSSGILNRLFGQSNWPWMVRTCNSEGRYPRETQVALPGQPVRLPLVLRPNGQPGRYLWIIDQNGVMHIAPEYGSLTYPPGHPQAGQQRQTKHTDLAELQPARISGELNPTNDPNVYVMNHNSGRYSSQRNEDGSYSRHPDENGKLRNSNEMLNQSDLGDSTVVNEADLYGQ